MGVIKQPLLLAGNNGWPFGSDGSLTILSGQVVTLAHGDIKDYAGITINSGGILQVVGGNFKLPTIIGCNGTFTNNGTIKCNGFLFNGAVYNSYAPDGTSLISDSIVQALGGSGGAGGTYDARNGPGGGGAGTNGYGGGGGGGGGYSCSDCSSGGGIGGSNNGDGNDTQGVIPGLYNGKGNVTKGDGLPGTTNSRVAGSGGGSGGGAGNGNIYDLSGAGGSGGGGGGYKGLHGGMLFIKIAGTFSGSGLFDLSATNGFKGGAGGDSLYYGGGGGGGGGAGGSGGKLQIKCRINNWTGFYKLASGIGEIGGVNGSGGFVNYGSTKGSDGNAGAATVTTY